MKRFWLILLSLAFTMSLTVLPAFATGPSGGGTSLETNVENNIGNVGPLSPGAKTFSPEAEAEAIAIAGAKAKAVIEKGAVQVKTGDIENDVKVKTNVIVEPVQQVIIEKPDRALIELPEPIAGPNMEQFKGPYKSDWTLLGPVWMAETEWTEEMVKKLPSSSGIIFKDAKMEPIILRPAGKKSTSFKVIAKLVPGMVRVGQAVVYSEVSGVSVNQLFKAGAEEVFPNGAQYVCVTDISFMFGSDTKGAGVGLNGGGSAVNNGKENFGGSMMGGTYIGKITAKPTIMSALYIEYGYLPEGYKLPAPEAMKADSSKKIEASAAVAPAPAEKAIEKKKAKEPAPAAAPAKKAEVVKKKK